MQVQDILIYSDLESRQPFSCTVDSAFLTYTYVCAIDSDWIVVDSRQVNNLSAISW